MSFLRNSDDKTPAFLASESLLHAENRYAEAERDVDTTQDAVERAERDNDEDTFKGGSKIADAYEKLRQAEGHRDAALIKLNWERREEWKKTIPTDKKATKHLMQSIDWKNIRTPTK